ncbi:30S ribosomal protein S1 [Nannocystis bainbridge]|uniref:S1 RNA-binding domain-containing protein n=1 Tax=Nannocystis bainbridge TaxID=2995303 RepID=A0ABT5E189_9BACT|nr:S1 RNA-binding domain-containing protein [Nannocystis bainbridge]MDC0719599.1 S1 RNA-binding domain-containing protein [Nannocystis bainbridge]
MAQQQDEDFAAMFEAQGAQTRARLSKRVRPGQLVEGPVVEIGADSVFLDIGAKSEGRIERAQLLDKEGNLKVKIGDKLRATVASVSGGIQLVVAIGRGGIDTQSLDLALQSGVPVEATVTKAVKAGLEVELGSVRAFCPASQVDLGFAQDLERFVGTKQFFKVIEIRDGGRSVIVSRKAVLKDERENQAKAVRERLVVGAELEGIVQTIQPYGAFVDLGGIEGMIHISELGHGRVDKIDDVIKIGESVKVRVLAVEPRGTSPTDLKISLSMKSADQTSEPTTSAATEQVLAGKVGQVTNFGVFVDTEAGRGLVPLSELGLPPNADPRRAFPVGKDVEVVMLGRGGGEGKLRFSIQGVAAAEERTAYKTFAKEAKKGAGGSKGLGSLGDLMKDLQGKLPDAKPAQSRDNPSDAKPAATRRRA